MEGAVALSDVAQDTAGADRGAAEVALADGNRASVGDVIKGPGEFGEHVGSDAGLLGDDGGCGSRRGRDDVIEWLRQASP